MHLSLTETEVPFFSVAVSLALGAMFLLLIWGFKFVIKNIEPWVKASGFIGRAAAIFLLFLWEVVSATVIYYSRKALRTGGPR